MVPKTLTIKTLTGSIYGIPVSDDYVLPNMDDQAWVNVEGRDGTGVAVHTKNIESLYLTHPSTRALDG